MKKNKKTITIIAVAVAAIGVMTASMFVYDWYKYNSENYKINNYIESLEGVDKSTISSDNYCTYSHQKYSKGVLGCNILYTASSENITLFRDSKKTAESFGWKFKWDNTVDNNKYSKEKYIKSEVYEYKNLYCSFVVKDTGKNYKYELGCSGPAKAEWFPVQEN